MRRRIWQFLLPIHHDVSSDRAWLPYREPWVSCQHGQSFFFIEIEEFPDLPHMPAHSQQSGRQKNIARTHTWQQCSVSTSGAILTTKYGFNLRQNSPQNIENNTGYYGWIRVSVVHALIGPQSLKLAHFWSDIRWFPPLLFHYIPLHDWKRAGETVLNATVPTSPPGDHSQVESPARDYCAKNSAYVNKAG